MIKIYYGEDRVRAQAAIQEFLGEKYEVIDGTDLRPADLPSLLMGGTLFAEERAIMIRDLSENREVFSKLVDYTDTPHRVALFEAKIDKRSSTYKALKDKVEFYEFVRPRDPNAGLVFEIYTTAKRDGIKAVEMAKRIEPEQDPIMFMGLMVSQAIKDYQRRPNGAKEKKALRELSELDMQLKQGSKLQPWLLIYALLLRVSSW